MIYLDFAIRRRVEENYIDLDQMAMDNKIDRSVEGSPSGYYPCIVVPREYVGRKVLVILLSEDDAPVSLEGLLKI